MRGVGVFMTAAVLFLGAGGCGLAPIEGAVLGGVAFQALGAAQSAARPVWRCVEWYVPEAAATSCAAWRWGRE